MITPAFSTIHIACAADGAFLRHVPVMLSSVRENTTRPLHVSIVSTHWNLEDQRKLSKALHGFEVEFLTLSRSMLDGLPHKAILSPLAYARIFMPDLIRTNRFIYLDIDMIVRQDIAQLWEIDLADAPAAAVFHNDGTQLNSGLMLVSAQVWREMGLGETILQWARDNQPKEADQAATEAVIGSQMLRLDPSWNSLVDPVWGKPMLTEQYCQSASILHYITGFKPWNLGRFLLPSPFVREWDRYSRPTGIPVDWRAEIKTLMWQARVLIKRLMKQ